ncbi:MAG: hypothetical protein CSA62_02540 [Planctomycetota bacterium]|nr:MAG: hypothetical protein CSA62_02540 [Planctomycetota bacterium]
MRVEGNTKVFVTGATGYLGHEVQALLRERGIAWESWGRDGFDLEQPFALDDSVRQRLERMREEEPEAVPLLLHMGAESRWGSCEDAPERAWRINAEASGVLAAAVTHAGGRVVLASTDLVFEGEHAPYDVTREAKPLSSYGRSKRAAEWYVLGGDEHLVVRLPLLYGPSFDGRRGATDMILRAAEEGRRVQLFVDEWRTPMTVRAAAEDLLNAALDPDLVGILHPEVGPRLSRWELGLQIAAEYELDPEPLLEMASRHGMPGPARPEDCSLLPGHAPRA